METNTTGDKVLESRNNNHFIQKKIICTEGKPNSCQASNFIMGKDGFQWAMEYVSE